MAVEFQHIEQHHYENHAIAVVAKCPIPGKSKTRLISLLGEEGSAKLAKAMLSDVLVTLSACDALNRNHSRSSVQKILCYAPANDQGLSIMSDLLEELRLVQLTNDYPQDKVGSLGDTDDEGWILLPMIPTDLNATNLGHILTGILARTRQQQSQLRMQGKIIFLGMDCPELPLEEIVASLFGADDSDMKSKEEKECHNANQKPATGKSGAKNRNVASSSAAIGSAVVCPANDGGYGMLCVPPQAPTEAVFAGIRWSDPLTALGQIKALTDCNIPVRLGRMMNDIDEPEDVQALCQRLSSRMVPSKGEVTGTFIEQNEIKDEDGDVLLESSTFCGVAQTGDCRHTIRVLKELNLL